MKNGRVITPAGSSWLYEQVLILHEIPPESGYIDADLLYRTKQLKMDGRETVDTFMMFDDYSIITIDKRCVDRMPDMPDTFGGKWNED